MKQTTKLRTVIAAFVLVAVGAVIVGAVTATDDTAAGDDPVTIVATTTAPPETAATSTTVDAASVDAFLTAWSDAENAAAFDAFEAERARIAEAEAARAAEAEAARFFFNYSATSEMYTPGPSVSSGGGCVIPSYICQRESGFNYGAVNASSGAGGMYQFLQSTWDATAGQMGKPWLIGVPPQMAAPADQDAAAAWLWNGGAGCSHWSAC